LDISGDGEQILSFSRDRTVRVWDSESGQNTRVLISDDNKRALSSLGAGNAMLAESEVGPEVVITTKPIPRDPIIALSPDAKRVVLGSQGNVSTWDLSAGVIDDYDLGESDIVAVAFHPNSDLAVLGSLFGPLLVCDFEHQPTVLEGHVGRVLDVVVTTDGRGVISAGRDDTIRFWDLASASQSTQITGDMGKVDAVAIAPNGRLACSIYGDTLVVYGFDVAGRRASLSFDHQITTIAITPHGDNVVIGDQSGRLHHMSLQSWGTTA